MKTLSAKLLVGVIAVLAIVGCDKKKSNNNNYGYNYNQNYYQDSYGNCLDRRTNQQVSANYCYGNNQGGNYNGQYQIDPYTGYCTDRYTHQPVQQYYCQGGNGGGGGQYQQCYGQYYNQWNMMVTCMPGYGMGSSCSGQTLYSMQYQQWIYCQ